MYRKTKKLIRLFSSWKHPRFILNNINIIRKFLFFCLVISFFIVWAGHASNAHHDEWVSAKIFPSLALSNGYDLYQTSEGPYLLTIYGPASAFFFLPVCLGSTPEQSIWIATSLNLFFAIAFILLVFDSKKSSRRFTVNTELLCGFACVFILSIEKTTTSLFQVHHDLPVLSYLLAASLFLFRKNGSSRNVSLWIACFFIWLACWSKIIAIPWLMLPFVWAYQNQYALKSKSTESSSLFRVFYALLGTGTILALIFGFLFGFEDIWFHLFESTNSYPWRSCNSLFGEGEEPFIASDFLSKVPILFRIILLYLVEYWWLALACVLIGIHNFKSKEGRILLWLVMCYFLSLPTCLSALAKFGGVANSLVFAHVPAFAALFLQGSKLIDKLVPSDSIKISVSFMIAIIPALAGIRMAKAIGKDSSVSPLQLGYEYLLENPNKPVFFALAPLPNYFATGKIWSSGEALTYTTMISKDALPKDAGMDGPKEIPLIAFGTPPYSITFFEKKFNLKPVSSPANLRDWSLFRATPKTE